MRRTRLFIVGFGGLLGASGIIAACATSTVQLDFDAGVDQDTGVTPPKDSGNSDAPKTDAGCNAGETKCGPNCKNLQTDPQNCGTCGTPCPNGNVCENGTCHLGCSPQTRCIVSDSGADSGIETCVDIQTNAGHCGAGHAACPSAQYCDAGSCDLDCTDAGVKCVVPDAGLTCIDTKTNINHCGACNAPCTGGKVCVNSACITQVATNIAPLGTVTISGGGSSGNYLPSQANNGVSQITNCNMFAWISAGGAPATDWMQVDWGVNSHIVNSVTVDTNTTGTDSCGNSGRVLAGAQVQYWNGATWVTSGTVSAQTGDWTYTFPAPVTTTKVRLYAVYATGGQGSNPIVFELIVNGT